jgi:hypothetical protein
MILDKSSYLIGVIFMNHPPRNRQGHIGGPRLLTNLPTPQQERKFTERLGLKSRTKRNQNPSFSDVSEKRGVCNQSEATLVALHFGLTSPPTTLVRYSREPFQRMSRPFGLMNTQTTFTRCLRRTPDLEVFWFDYRTLFAETSFLSGSVIS